MTSNLRRMCEALAAQGVRLILVPTANMQPFTHVARAHRSDHGGQSRRWPSPMPITAAIEGDLTYVGGSLSLPARMARCWPRRARAPALLIADLPAAIRPASATQLHDFRRI